MLYTIPDYYRQFHCVAGACEDTCCAGWQIVADKSALRQYKKVTGEYRKEIRAGVDWKEGAFRQDEEKRCYFLNEDNLCNMYTALGEKALCKTCKRYPRHIEEFEGDKFAINLGEYIKFKHTPILMRDDITEHRLIGEYEVSD